jgi:DNA repair protein RecO (recombination protein O)
MLIKTKAIVIATIRYQEKSLIVKCYTKSDGLKSYFVRNAYGGKNNTQKKVYFQPLTILEIAALHKNKGNLEYFKEVKPAVHYQTIGTDHVKTAMVMFLSEILHHSILEEEKNEPLFDFLEASLLWLDSQDQVANFHLILMLEMTKFLGFYPDVTSINLTFFDIIEGVFTNDISSSSVNEKESNLIKHLLRLSLDAPFLAFNVADRQILLKILITYYTTHLGNFKTPKSLEVFREVFE